MAARLTLKSVNDELARLGHRARLEKASGYLYFYGGEATDWIDRTVQVAKISDLTLDQWIAEFARLKRINADLMRQGGAGMGTRSRLDQTRASAGYLRLAHNCNRSNAVVNFLEMKSKHHAASLGRKYHSMASATPSIDGSDDVSGCVDRKRSRSSFES